MSKKDKEQKDLAEAEKKEREHIKLQLAYEEYAFRMQGRIEKDEKVEIKPFESWIRKAKKIDEHGNKIEIEVAGDTGETKNEKFRRLAMKRMDKALKALDTVMNLSSTQYESTEAEQGKLINALRLKVLDIENSFKVIEKKQDLFDFEE